VVFKSQPGGPQSTEVHRINGLSILLVCQDDAKDSEKFKQFISFFARCLEFEEQVEGFLGRNIHHIFQENDRFVRAL